MLIAEGVKVLGFISVWAQGIIVSVIIATIIENFNGGPVGVDTISASTGEERITVEDVYEPYLLQIGFLNRTPRGRVISKKAYEHFKIPFEED